MLIETEQEGIFKKLSSFTKDTLKNSDILITGGSGFFGKNFLDFFHWYQLNHNNTLKISILSRHPEKLLKQFPHFKKVKNFEFIESDIKKLKLKNKQYSHIIHAATTSSAQLNIENPLEMANTIVFGTYNILEYARKNSIENFLLVSSGAVYGKQPTSISHVTEEYIGAPNCLDPANSYHETKRIAELYTNIYSKTYHIQTKIARCFAFVGPYLEFNIHFAIGNFIYDALFRNEILIKGDGTPLRSYLYSSDLVIWLLEILFRGDNNEAYNVGSEDFLSIKELAHIVAYEVGKITGEEAKITINKQPGKELPERYVPSIEKAKIKLNITASVSLQDAIFKTAHWLYNSKKMM